MYVLLEIDPNIVKPGWTPLIITILLAGVVALLMISMRRHLRRIDLPHRDEVDNAAPADGATTEAAGDKQGDQPRSASQG